MPGRSIRSFTVLPSLPARLQPLHQLAYNLWWTWTPEARQLFAAVDGVKWARYRNPVQLLINVDARHWYPLLDDEQFQRLYRKVTREDIKRVANKYFSKNARVVVYWLPKGSLP